MSLLFRQRANGDDQVNNAVGRVGSGPLDNVTEQSAMRHSAVWACIRLRADLESTLPIDVFRRAGVDDIAYEVPPTPFITNPGGDRWGRSAWMYSSRVSLDRCGNNFGLILARDGLGLPAVVELVGARQVTVKGRGPDITGYTIAGKNYPPEQVWHERQFTEPGIPVGLSPVAHAALSLGMYASAEKFAADYYRQGGTPLGELAHKEWDTITPAQAAKAKERFRATTEGRELWVHGKDWEFKPFQAAASDTRFLEAMKSSAVDVSRFFGVPGDLIDAESGSTSITYANITQRNLQLLVMNLGPAFVRREAALSAALPSPRFVKLNTDALLRMDPQSREQMLGSMVTNRQLAPSEARELDNRPPFTDAQLAEFDRFWPPTRTAPATVPAAPKGDV